MPQLVRSVLGAVADIGAHPTRLLHPVIQVHRDAGGRLLDAEPAVLGQRKGRRESWICVTVTGATDAEELAHRVRQALAEAADVHRDTDTMRNQLRTAADGFRQVRPDQDGAALLEWMAAGNVTVLATVAHSSADRAADRHILGVARLAGDPGPFPAHEPVGGITIRHIPADLIWAQQHPLLEFGVRLSDDRLLRFVCFLTRSGRTADVATTPVLRGVSQAVLAMLQAPVGSYTAGELVGGVLDRLPRTILFTLPIGDIVEMVRDTVTVSIRPRVHTRLFRTADRRTAVVLVLLARDRYSAGSASQIAAAVVAATGRPGLVAADHRSEAPTATVTVTLPVPADWDLVAAEAVIRTSVDEIFRSWAEQLARRLPGDHATALGGVAFEFDASYQLDRSIDDAVRDLTAIETLSDEHPIEVALRDLDISTASATVELFSRRDLTLSDILPVIHNLGVRVVDERAYRVAGRNGLACVAAVGAQHGNIGPGQL
jgi:glutamate dehydrogenase